jgi:CheY-like chemotaxis protein
MQDVFEGRFTIAGLRPATIADVAAAAPHLLFVDALPADGGPDGWELIGMAREHATLREVPIILCTDASVQDGDLDRLGSYTNVHLLAKPFELDVLEGLVRRVAP